jgi:hypothetical protein
MALLITNQATRVFGSMGQGDSMLSVPRFKFNFQMSMGLGNNTSERIFEKIKDVSLPDISFETQIINQYNIKRVVQTKMNYGECTISFYDTFDNDFMDNVFKPYTERYYNSGTGISPMSNNGDRGFETNNVTLPNFETDIGYTPMSSVDKYFIPSITVSNLQPTDSFRKTKMRNCMITSMTTDTLSYSDSEMCSFTVTFQPERVEVQNDSR